MRTPLRIRPCVVLAAGAFCLSACDASAWDTSSESTTGTSSSGAGGAGGGPPTLQVVPGAPAPPAKEPDSTQATVEGYVSAVGSNGALVAIGTTTGVYQASPQGVTELPIVGDEPDLPLTTGHVRAIAPYQSGVLVAADEALFYTQGDVLQLSMGNGALHPLGIAAMASRVADDDGDGTDEIHLTVTAGDAVYELVDALMVKWTVDGEAGPPTAAYAQKDTLYVAYGHHVYQVEKAERKAYPLVFDIGSVSEIACDSLACEEGSLLYFATDAGLVERGSDGNYTLYSLAKDGAAAVPAETFAFDAGRQRLYALAGDSVLRVHAGAVPEAVATMKQDDGALPRRMAFDKLGDLWAGSGADVRSFALGTPLSFETDVKPIVHEYCALCHTAGKNGAPEIDFESYDTMVELTDKALTRISEGSMPPPGYPAVPKDKLQILQDWAPTKAP